MPGQFTDKNGGNMAGHADKWSHQNRRPGSHEAGQGSRGSRNQGTGSAGKANTVATQGTDTSNMSKLDKLKYFNSLGLLSPAQKQELDAMENPPQKATPEPKPESKPIIQSNPVKELSDKLGKIFAHKPQLLQGIVNELKSVKPEELKDKAQAILSAMQKNSSTEPTEVFSTIMRAIKPEQAQAQPEKPQQPKGNAGGVMSPEEFHKDFDYLGKDFVNSLIKQASYFEDPEKALFHISMATDNADINDDAAIRSSMASAADDLGSFFEPKGQDDIEFDEPEDDYISDDNRQWDQLVNFFKADSPAGKEDRVRPDKAEYIIDKIENRLDGDNLDKMRLAKSALDKAMQNYVPGEQSRYITGMNAVFGAFKQYEQEHGEKVSPDGYLIKQKDVAKNADLPNSSGGITKPEYEDFGTDKEGYDYAVQVYKVLKQKPELESKMEPVFANAWDNYESLGYDRPAEAAYWEVSKKLQEMGIDPFEEAPEDTSAMDAELAKDREFGPKSQEDYDSLLNTIVELGKKAGVSNKVLNRSITWVKDEIGHNGRKLQQAWNYLHHAFDDMSLESPEAYEYAMNTLDNAFSAYNSGDVTDFEKDIMSKYGK